MLSQLCRRRRAVSRALLPLVRFTSREADGGKRRRRPPPPPPPKPPRPPQKPASFTFHDFTWQDSYSWMADLQDGVATRHMDAYMEQEEQYTDDVMASLGAERLLLKLQSEMAVRLASDVCTPPVRWGPWIYYTRVEEGKQYPILCRQSASVNEEFVSYNDPSAGFDYNAGRRIEQKLLDYNAEADRFGVSGMAWAMDGKALLYVVTNHYRRPYKILCSMIGSKKEDVLILEESGDNVFVNVRNTKDFRFVAVNIFSETSSKVFLIDAAQPFSGMSLIWESEAKTHCIVEHHRGYLYMFTDAAQAGVPVDSHYLLRCTVENSSSRAWEGVFIEEPGLSIEDVDFCDSHLVLTLRQGKLLRLCSICLPLPAGEAVHLAALNPRFLPLPKHVSQISSGTNYDYLTSTMRFVISSPVMPVATVDYNLSNGKWKIVHQQNIFHERTMTLYGKRAAKGLDLSEIPRNNEQLAEENDSDVLWNGLSEYYACDYYDVPSEGGVMVPLTTVYSRKHKKEGSPGLLHGHGAYGEVLDKAWRYELKSLLDRGWVVAYADVRGSGGRGKQWHHDGRGAKKQNSIKDYVSCAQFLIDKGIVQDGKLAGCGYSAGGLLVASAINKCPDLFRAAVLKVPFLDALNTLLYPVLPITPIEYEEFGCPGDIEEFKAIKDYSPYENIQKDAIYPAVLVTSSFNTRFGVWEAAKWIARIRELTFHDPKRPKLLYLAADTLEESKYLELQELALETAFLIKMTIDPEKLPSGNSCE
ncbi:prolyl oligopeptidase family protein isoform X2 [Wolffia australiana]